MGNLLFYMVRNQFSRRYEYKVSIDTTITFCEEILDKLNIPKKSTPLVISFYKGTEKSFCLEKVIKKEWVKEKHRLDGEFYETEVMVEKTSINYLFNGVPLISRPVNLDYIFTKFGNKIQFDCYYHEL